MYFPYYMSTKDMLCDFPPIIIAKNITLKQQKKYAPNPFTM